MRFRKQNLSKVLNETDRPLERQALPSHLPPMLQTGHLVESTKTALGRMGRKLRATRGRTRYKARKHIVEPPFGWIESVMGFRL